MVRTRADHNYIIAVPPDVVQTHADDHISRSVTWVSTT